MNSVRRHPPDSARWAPHPTVKDPKAVPCPNLCPELAALWINQSNHELKHYNEGLAQKKLLQYKAMELRDSMVCAQSACWCFTR